MNRKKKIKILGAAMLICIIACIVTGRLTKKSYVDNVELSEYLLNPDLKVAFCGMGYDDITYKGYIDEKMVESVDDFIDGSDIIVKVKLKKDSKRQLYYECVLSQVEIEVCYKGELKAGNAISVFEPVDCYTTRCLYCTDGYSLMEKDTEYILFLKQLKNTFFGHDKYVYAPSCTTFSKYTCNDEKPKLFTSEELTDEDSMYTYPEIKGTDVYLYDNYDYDKYVSLKEKVNEKFIKETINEK